MNFLTTKHLPDHGHVQFQLTAEWQSPGERARGLADLGSRAPPVFGDVESSQKAWRVPVEKFTLGIALVQGWTSEAQVVGAHLVHDCMQMRSSGANDSALS
jgi:hypothetical protein